jgi:RimJ/RimL family protein N-acetyltransferase
MRYFKKIEGERVYLSPINVDDYEIYTKWVNDIEVARGINLYDKMISLGNEKEILEKLSSEKHNYAIIEKNENRLLGNCSLSHIDEKNQTAEFGIFIGEASDRGKGYGSEAAKLIVNYGFNYLNLENIMLKVFDFNTQAIRAYEKAGFKKFGERKNVYYFDGKKHNEIFMEILRDNNRGE